MVMYMEGIKYINLVQISLVGIGVQGDKQSKLAVPVNNIFVCSMFFWRWYTTVCLDYVSSIFMDSG